MELRIANAMEACPEDIGAIAELLRSVFDDTRDWDAELKWQYLDNPHGRAVYVNAYAEENRLVAHYAVIPTSPFVEPAFAEIKTYLSLNTAVHPTAQGKGLFKKTASALYMYLSNQGRHVVLGVANENSVHGFISSLGFYLLGNLRLEVRPPLVMPVVDHPRLLALDSKTMAWRFARPHHEYLRIGTSRAVTFRRSFKGLPVQCIMTAGGAEGELPRLPTISSAFLCLSPSVYAGYGLGQNFSVPVPGALRPSPLNFIARPSADIDVRVLLNHVQCRTFEFVDFDVV